MKIRFRHLSILAAWSAFAACTCSVATDSASLPRPDAPVVYVSNFELDALPEQDGNASRGLLGGALQGGLLRRHKDPQAQAQEISALMAETLTKDLKKAGIDARRTQPGAELPKTGWNVHGVFLSVDQGNVARRAMIGFGAGHSSLQVAVAIDDLAKPGQSLQSVAEGSGGHMPGAIIMLNPYAIAAKVVLAGRDQEKAVKNAAKQIADTIVRCVQPNVSEPAVSHTAS
ncbi:DUF4410 domain-containing protein [Dyella choica]|uniref:DUF4410 domain-containing protein n=1 Tax=Dyella choica TaxID=1927959 RepID=A0A432MBN1_9GAMM|nr:DUF4410 domain-containing protein [Dyella choica]RUL79040.1 DUF4410 domain-containing protein [Dyella choica]